MARKSRCQHLLEKSVHAALSAIEIYNKPDFKYREIRKDGKPYKYPKHKKSRSGNYLTIDITNAIKNLELPERLKENLILLTEIRDNAVHFVNDSKLFERKFLETATGTLSYT